jgi:hypothetical protein
MFDPKDPNGFNQLKAVQPEALEVRVEGMCESCRRSSLLSYILPNTQANPDPSQEYCGYYCIFCKFSAAGERDKRGIRIKPYTRKTDDESNLPKEKTSCRTYCFRRYH